MMKAYALAKLIAESEGVDARKRLQKCVFLLQKHGCNMDAIYFMHYYGPYSSDVAETTDVLTQSGLLDEKSSVHPWGEQYAYTINEENGRRLLREFEGTEEGRSEKERIERFVEDFKSLCDEPLWTLELAATMAFYKTEEGCEWNEAKEKTSQFKRVGPGESVLVEAECIAKRFAERRN